MILLILLNGNPNIIIDKNGLSNREIKVIKTDEKSLSNPGYIIKTIKGSKCNSVFFGNKENELQRFHIFMKLYMLLSFVLNGAIIDEYGNQNKFNILKLLFIEIPRLAFEALVTIVTIVYFYIKIPFLKWKLMKKV
jgi:hypothetical protein